MSTFPGEDQGATLVSKRIAKFLQEGNQGSMTGEGNLLQIEHQAIELMLRNDRENI